MNCGVRHPQSHDFRPMHPKKVPSTAITPKRASYPIAGPQRRQPAASAKKQGRNGVSAEFSSRGQGGGTGSVMCAC
eukprot:scaffold111283_cov29-Tisochrysis_lutea.AAC.2